MRILLNGRFLARPMTGVDRSALNLARGIAETLSETSSQCHRLDVAVPNGAPNDAEIRALLSLPDSSRIFRSKATGYLWEQILLGRLEPESTLLSLCNMGPVSRKNQLIMIHDAQVYDVPDSYSFMFRSAYRLLLPILAKRAKGVMTVSEFSRGRLKANRVVTSSPIKVVPNAADHLRDVQADMGVLARFDLKREGYLLALGGSAQHKNLPMLLKACSARTQASLPLVIAGETGPLGTSDSPVADEHILLGRVSDHELRALFENARMFLFPSLTEGFGLPALEAMQLGCPVIASSAGAIPEVVGDAAILCEPNDTPAWTATIESLQRDGEACEKLRNEGRKQAAKFEWQRSSAMVLEFARASE